MLAKLTDQTIYQKIVIHVHILRTSIQMRQCIWKHSDMFEGNLTKQESILKYRPFYFKRNSSMLHYEGMRCSTIKRTLSCNAMFSRNVDCKVAQSDWNRTSGGRERDRCCESMCVRVCWWVRGGKIFKNGRVAPPGELTEETNPIEPDTFVTTLLIACPWPNRQTDRHAQVPTQGVRPRKE